LDTICKIDASNAFGLKLVGVKPEFRRLFASLETQHLSFYENVDGAVVSFTACGEAEGCDIKPAIVEIQAEAVARTTGQAASSSNTSDESAPDPACVADSTADSVPN